jgi:major membrane immunogen (membrane-anchored lipoprotein)
MKAPIAICLSILLVACGGGDEDDGAVWAGASLSNAEREAIEQKCAAHGSLQSARRVIVIEADGEHRYIRGVCTDGTTFQIE